MTSGDWKLIVDGSLPGALNMAIDEGLLRQTSSPSSPPVTYLRFYRWIRPTLSLGFSQKASRVVDLEFCKMRDIDVVRRPTGGKAVLHHHEVTYSVTSNDRRHFPCNDIGATYLKIARALADGFREMDLEVSLAPENPACRRDWQAILLALPLPITLKFSAGGENWLEALNVGPGLRFFSMVRFCWSLMRNSCEERWGSQNWAALARKSMACPLS
jgi:hypothetical protein